MRSVWLAAVLTLALVSPAAAGMRDLVLTTVRTDAKGASKESSVKMIDLVGRKPVVILYWLPQVESSVAELKRFDAMARAAAKSPVQYYAATRVLDETEGAAAAAKIRALKLAVPVILDRGLVLAEAMQAQFIPTYYGLNAKGSVAFANLASLIEPTTQGKTLEQVLPGAVDLPSLTTVVPRELKAGDLAPDFELPDLGGKTYRLAETRKAGKPTLLIFWSAYCPHCQKELPKINEFLRANPGAYSVLSLTRITSEQDRIMTGAFVANNGLVFPVLTDGGATLTRYHVTGIPMWMVVDPSGRIVTVQTGEQRSLESLLTKYKK